ncbi:MAG TPA: AsmA-like C-terminal region-containing protein, partial [Candidatus Polarisedimenticolaceae bacterium]|nr:AsmA-like C-terminal region-containing protein [Candidatus Polarisedimenticolaceae bacterium]
LRALRSIEARVRLSAEELNLPAAPLRDVTIDAAVRDGALRVEPIAGTGANGGRAQGRFVLEPDGDGYRARLEGRLDGGRLHLPRGDIPPSETPTVDLELELAGSGRSLHEIASRSDGRVLAVLGAGHITNTIGDLATSAPIQGLLDALNPFRKSSPYTDFECGIAAASITAGKAEVEPIAARTDKMTIVGRGKVDLDTEAIDLVWTIKPRRGVGITPGSIANPYIKLGGTLGDPSIEAKPLEAAASTGAAVATGGLTLLFRGIYDRITAERKVCVNALERARKDEAERKAAP